MRPAGSALPSGRATRVVRATDNAPAVNANAASADSDPHDDGTNRAAWLKSRWVTIGGPVLAVLLLGEVYATFSTGMRTARRDTSDAQCVTIATAPGSKPVPDSDDRAEFFSGSIRFRTIAAAATEACLRSGCPDDMIQKTYLPALNKYLWNRKSMLDRAHSAHGREGIVFVNDFYRNAKDLTIIDAARELARQKRLDFSQIRDGHGHYLNLLITHRLSDVPLCFTTAVQR